jgi:hypothetical protein
MCRRSMYVERREHFKTEFFFATSVLGSTTTTATTNEPKNIVL